MALTPARCPTCDAPLRIPNGSASVDCLRCETSFLLPGAALQERNRTGLWVAGAVLVVGLSTLAVGAASMATAPFVTTHHTTVVIDPPADVPVPLEAPEPILEVEYEPVPVMQPVPQVPAPIAVSTTNPNPDWVNDPEALRQLPARLHAATTFTGNIDFIQIDGPTRAVVASVEVEGGAHDTVVFSWGQVIVKPRALTAEDHADLAERTFTMTPDQFAALAPLGASVRESRETETEIASISVMHHWVDDDVQVLVKTEHPRIVRDPAEFTLAGLPTE